MNTAATNFSLNTLNCRWPLLEIAEITFAPNRWPVPSITGVWPDRAPGPAGGMVGAKPISSAHRIKAFSRRARCSIAG